MDHGIRMVQVSGVGAPEKIEQMDCSKWVNKSNLAMPRCRNVHGNHPPAKQLCGLSDIRKYGIILGREQAFGNISHGKHP
jgi:hypothetical protein